MTRTVADTNVILYAIFYLMVLIFIGMYHSAERVQKPIQRMLFVGSNFVNDAVKSFNR